MTTHTSSKYALDYVVSGSALQKHNSLVDGGPLKVQAEHWLFKVLPPNEFDRTRGDIRFTVHKLEWLMLDIFTWSPELKARNMAWVLKNTRAAKFLHKADSLGHLPWDKMMTIEEAMILLHKIAKLMPPADLLLDESDVDAYPETSDGDICFYRVKAKHLAGADGAMTAVVDFKSALADGYIEGRRDDEDGLFAAMLDACLDVAGKDLADKSLAIQASRLAAFFKKSQPDAIELRVYHPWDAQDQEVLRRGEPDESARFVPLLEAVWDNGSDGGFKQLKQIIMHACSGKAATQFFEVMATRARLDGGLTSSSCTALCDMLRGNIVSDLDSPENILLNNADRARVAGDLLATAMAKTATEHSSKDTAAIEKMHADQGFKDLVRNAELLNVQPVNYDKVVKLLAATACGRIFIVKGKAAIQVFENFRAARKNHNVTNALNSAIAFNQVGVPLETKVVDDKVGPLLIAGCFGPAQFDPWRDIGYLFISVRDGSHPADKQSQDASGTFWADKDRLSMTEGVMSSVMSFIGHGGNTPGHYPSFHQGMTRRALMVSNLPDDLVSKEGLTRMLIKIGTETMDLAAARDQTMLEEAIHQAALSQPFMQPGSNPYKLLTAFEKDLAEAQNEVRQADLYGRKKSARWLEPEPTPLQQPWQHQQPWQQQWEDYEPPAKKPREQGGQLRKWGAHHCEHGLIFGCKFLVVMDTAKAESLKQARTCLGKISYLRDPSKRSEWCSQNCSNVEHHRPQGMTEAEFEVINLHSATLSTQHAELAKKVLDAKIAWQHLGGPDNREDIMGGVGGGNPRPASESAIVPASRGRGNPSSATTRGNGKGGKGGGKGFGKGGGKGQGKGKGKGKGKGGRARQSFGWQRN